MEKKDFLRETLIHEIKKYIIPIDISFIVTSSADDLNITYVLKETISFLSEKSYKEGISLQNELPYNVNKKVDGEIKSLQNFFAEELNFFMKSISETCNKERGYKCLLLDTSFLSSTKIKAIILLSLYVNCPYLSSSDTMDVFLRKMVFYKILF